jgi:hypothetical protein
MTKFHLDRRDQLNHLPIILAIVALTASIVGATLMVDRAATLIADRLFPETHSGTADMPGSPEPPVSVAPFDPAYIRGSGQRRSMAEPASARPGTPLENRPTQLDQ